MPSDGLTSSSGLRDILASLIGTLILVVLVNGLVDPYGYFGIVSVNHLNQRKPVSFQHDRFLKAGLLRRSSADCVLAGNSRVGEGIPASHATLRSCRQVLDISLAGPNVTETLASVELALARNPDARLIVNLDFFSFNALRDPTRGGDESMFREGLVSRTRTAASALLSKDVFLDSLSTPARQKELSFYDASGNVNQDYLAAVSAQRPTRATFLRGLRGYIFHQLPAPRFDYRVTTDSHRPLDELAAFLGRQQQRRSRITLFFSPAHVWQWELIDALGLWNDWETWRQAVATINDAAAAGAGRQAYALWDFVDYAGASTEDVPAGLDVSGPLSNYWDNSHFRQSLGARILDRMAGEDMASDGFGRLLTGGSVGAANQEIRNHRQAWRASHPADHQDIRKVVGCFAPAELQQRLRLARPEADDCRRLTMITR